MKKRSCRMTAEEKLQHETAVKIRKMTDGQICDFLDENCSPGNAVAAFFEKLNELKGTGNGISTGTIYKLRKIAVEHGFLKEEQT